jgi:beta-galactosidase
MSIACFEVVVRRNAFVAWLVRLMVLAGAGLGLQLSAADGPRMMQSLDRDWRFHLGAAPGAVDPAYDDSTWPQVDVPHDYVIDGAFSPTTPYPDIGSRADWHWLHGFLPVQPAVYRKILELPAAAQGRRLWLEFDGVFSNSRYWLNGKEIGRQYSGYTRSRFDITDAATCGGRNVLVVEMDPRYDGWWYEGGGIYRHVRLVSADPVHIAPDGVFVTPACASTGDGATAEAKVRVSIELANATLSDVRAELVSEILDPDGRVAASDAVGQQLERGGGAKLARDIALPGARLWSPDHPNLYRLRSTVLVSGKMVDQVTTTFGVREVRFDPNRGLFLNGRALRIQGVNMHEDHAGVGVAMPDRLFTWRLERLKEMGCNAIRLSHNPVAPVLLDECDRLGFLVVAENRHLGDTFEDQSPKETKAVEHRDLSALIVRDRNHPSIILWSLCNEQWIQGTPEAAAMASAMKQRVRELDPTRPVTAALNGGFDSPTGLGSTLDVIGINYHPDVYDAVHALFPHTPIFGSEIASEVGTRGVYALNHWETYWGDRERGYVAAYSINTAGAQVVEDAWPPVVARPFVAGGFVWAGFDYKGEPRPFGWPVINSHYGFMDICGFPKDSYYYYKSWWTDAPVLHVFPHWNWSGKEGQEIPVWVHSNCEEVELFLNGVSQGRQTTRPNHHLEWKVKYAPGRLVAKGVHRGRSLEAVRETTGAPAAIRLTADRSELAADNADLAVVNVEVVDGAGRVVPDAGNLVSFRLAGPAKLIGVGNGDPSCHEPDKADRRSAFNGLAQAIVQTTTNAGAIELEASSSGLQPGRVSLRSR